MSFTYFLYYFYIFVFGACIGSFLNVVSLRLPEGEDFIKGRSACPHCGKILRGRDMVPLLSYFFLKGRCGNCKQKISPRYPVVEAVAGALFLLCFWKYGPTIQAINACILASLLLLVFLIDMDTMTIPNGIVLCFLLPALLELWLLGFSGIGTRILGIFIISLPMLVFVKLLPGSFGGGDIKLMAVCGFLLGYQAALLASFIAIVSAGLVAAFLLLSKKVKKGDHIAFGPYLAVGIFIAKLFYHPLIGFYLSLLRVS